MTLPPLGVVWLVRSPEVKKAANEPPIDATTTIAHTCTITSTMRPAVVSGFGRCDEMVSS